jgi:hypothetical protein
VVLIEFRINPLINDEALHKSYKGADTLVITQRAIREEAREISRLHAERLPVSLTGHPIGTRQAHASFWEGNLHRDF